MKYTSLATALFTVCLPALALGQTELPFEGFITDGNDIPILDAFSVEVRLYRQASGGMPFFNETHPDVLPATGYFHIAIGERQTLDPASFDGNDIYLGLTIVGEAEEMSPRQRIGFVPYAIRALSADTAGPMGPPGPIGPVGPAGPTGDPGPDGAIGAMGVPGATGVAGSAGTTGAAGPVGVAGPAGATGPVGAIGPIGATGGVGATGPSGVQGLTGPAGAIGVTGVAGPRGFVGPQGLRGLTGSQGASGPAGARGLTGATGAQGIVGPPGTTGAAGPRGLTGLPGATGAAGPQGTAGAAGARGLTGPAGARGVTGAAGATGPAGARGLTGLTGSAGPSGPAGARGANGATGATGPAGARGLTGPAGPRGLQGIPGVPCTNCVNDASIANRTRRVELTCRGGIAGPFGLVLRNDQAPIFCASPGPIDAAVGSAATIQVFMRSVTGTANLEPFTMAVYALNPGVTPPNPALSNFTGQTAAAFSTWTTGQSPQLVQSQNMNVILSVPTSGRGHEIVSVSVLYSAER